MFFTRMAHLASSFACNRQLPSLGASGIATAVLLIQLSAVSTPAAAAQTTHAHGDIGVVNFNVSCAPAVREDFDRAVGMLHHMMYGEARQAFERIARQDPQCAMAHWGIAMTLFQPLWPARPSEKDRQRGWDAVQHAKRLGIATPRERALVAAAEAFFREPQKDEWWPRIHRWADSMKDAYQQHPQDTETAAFYALSELAVGQAATDQAAHNARAAEVLAAVYAKEPRHPGGSHYTIHANDIAGRAGESPAIVRGYNEIAPDVPHALHMPSHIYVRLGEWPEVIEWNRRSAEAALNFPAGDRMSLHHAHALAYQLYAHLQRGEDHKARAVLDQLRAQEQPYQEDFASAFHLAAMPARYAVERRAWEEAAALEPRTPRYLAWDRYWWPEALTWFVRGLGAAHTGDLPRAREAERRMAELRQQADAAGEKTFATYIESDRLILSGRIAQAEGERGTALARMREAAELEGTVEKNPITPGALLPAHEAMGDLLLEQHRPEEALEAYKQSLAVWPNRYRSLLGAARAAAAANQRREAEGHYKQLLAITEGADTDRPGVREARDYAFRAR